MQQYSLSDHKYVRRELFNLHIKGGLIKPDKTQKLMGWWYDRTLIHKPKVVMEFGIGSESKDEFTEQPSSLRFDNYNQIRAVIFHLLRASVLLGKSERVITEQNRDYHLNKDIEALKEFYTEVLR